MPWDALEPAYSAVMCSAQGRPSKPARLVIGAMIIKHKLSLSDEETVLQIQENQYLQYFCGFETYVDALPFVPSLFVELRKRMGKEMFARFEQGIVDKAIAIQKAKPRKVKTIANKGDKPSSSVEKMVVSSKEETENEPSHHGRLLMDATVADQMIRFPTDFSLLNNALAAS